jgi:glutathione reductase (NADPH)
VVFSHPPVGSVGLSEAEARKQHGDAVKVRTTRFTPMLWSLAGREGKTMMKLVCVGDDERIVGLHGIGPGMDEMLQGFAVAVRMSARYADFLKTVAIHPTSAEEFVTMA